jgi:pyruvate/2-oxoglutarate dehydrogenase complex dihydrolipoamide acyltransferase (E2) component
MGEVDITDPRKLIREHAGSTGEKLSFTAYIVHCLAQVVSQHPHLNVFRKGNRLIPGFLLKTFIRIAERNIKLAKRYGKIGVTAVGMFSREPVWFIPHGSGTVLVTVGSIEPRTVIMDGNPTTREFLCLTVSFDHDIVDGAPAARFINQFLETLKSGIYLQTLDS